jgi:putative two-component system response regulator
MNLEADLYQARILIVDDQAPNVLLLERLLAGCGFTNVVSTTDSAEVLPMCAREEPDIVLLDLQMPAPDGFEVMSRLADRINAYTRLPILVLTADASRETKERALSSGASDFLNKPFEVNEVYLRIRNLLTTRLLHMELQRHNATLEKRVAERTRELEQARVEILQRLALAAEYRDDATYEHTERVASMAAALAKRLGHSDAEIELMRLAAPLHDIGKLGVADAILLKRGRLSEVELEVMRTHTTVGAAILAGSTSDVLQLAEQIALTHHEWWDGSGYPNGLSGSRIPLCGRIVALADVFDALTHARPYKEAWPVERAVEEVHLLRERQFDPEVVDAFDALDLDELTDEAEDTSRNLGTAA